MRNVPLSTKTQFGPAEAQLNGLGFVDSKAFIDCGHITSFGLTHVWPFVGTDRTRNGIPVSVISGSYFRGLGLRIGVRVWVRVRVGVRVWVRVRVRVRVRVSVVLWSTGLAGQPLVAAGPLE